MEIFFDLLHNSTLKSYFEAHYLSVKTWQTGTCKKNPSHIESYEFPRELLTF